MAKLPTSCLLVLLACVLSWIAKECSSLTFSRFARGSEHVKGPREPEASALSRHAKGGGERMMADPLGLAAWASEMRTVAEEANIEASRPGKDSLLARAKEFGLTAAASAFDAAAENSRAAGGLAVLLALAMGASTLVAGDAKMQTLRQVATRPAVVQVQRRADPVLQSLEEGLPAESGPAPEALSAVKKELAEKRDALAAAREKLEAAKRQQAAADETARRYEQALELKDVSVPVTSAPSSSQPSNESVLASEALSAMRMELVEKRDSLRAVLVKLEAVKQQAAGDATSVQLEQVRMELAQKRQALSEALERVQAREAVGSEKEKTLAPDDVSVDAPAVRPTFERSAPPGSLLELGASASAERGLVAVELQGASKTLVSDLQAGLRWSSEVTMDNLGEKLASDVLPAAGQAVGEALRLGLRLGASGLDFAAQSLPSAGSTLQTVAEESLPYRQLALRSAAQLAQSMATQVSEAPSGSNEVFQQLEAAAPIVLQRAAEGLNVLADVSPQIESAAAHAGQTALPLLQATLSQTAELAEAASKLPLPELHLGEDVQHISSSLQILSQEAAEAVVDGEGFSFDACQKAERDCLVG